MKSQYRAVDAGPSNLARRSSSTRSFRTVLAAHTDTTSVAPPPAAQPRSNATHHIIVFPEIIIAKYIAP